MPLDCHILFVSPAVGKSSSYQADVIAFATLIAKQQILLHWKSLKPPGTHSWFEELISFLHLENNQTCCQRILEHIL